MTPETLKHIQTICRDWLQRSALSGEIGLTILPGGPLQEFVEVELHSLITPDGTTISSAADVNTGAKYVSVLRKPGGVEVFIDTPIEKIPRTIDPEGNTT